MLGRHRLAGPYHGFSLLLSGPLEHVLAIDALLRTFIDFGHTLLLLNRLHVARDGTCSFSRLRVLRDMRIVRAVALTGAKTLNTTTVNQHHNNLQGGTMQLAVCSIAHCLLREELVPWVPSNIVA